MNWIICHAILTELAFYMIPAIAIVSVVISVVCYLVIPKITNGDKISFGKIFLCIFLSLFFLWFVTTDRIYW